MKHCDLCSRRSRETRRFVPATHLVKVKYRYLDRTDAEYYEVCVDCADTARHTMKNVEVRELHPVKLPFVMRVVAG